ncbi:3-oxoacyl-[acyl-carrier-protein] synthase-3 [Anaerovirgula multivorans]|uniref:3-oxoacyl-[acyl-carrier-protein] synthase-3 n=1 Tax=Anaerovirgula multivorans TaxID=312168 RepID=A0A239J5V1_9FIRM|nr:3-oxoacyl-[acyl-carrier-protein] synthase III C-terminal domain-containing protein [Anaerovirgula multivorans]SNT01195.1 3-oxoacyl-[acyl-carrier-protein] synthase-3 [Anaerovirgula multivorans]
MTVMNSIGIAGLGIYLPEDIAYVKEIQKQENLTDERIQDMGIVKLHMASDKVEPSDMAIEAAKEAMADAGVEADEIDALVYYTVFPDYLKWADYARIQHEIGAKNAYSFKVDQACCSSIIGLDYALARLKTDPDMNTVLVVCADKYEKPLVNRWKAANANFYGDGASAAIIRRGVTSNRILGVNNITDGSFNHLWYIPVGGTKEPPTSENVRAGRFVLDCIKTASEYLSTEENRKKLYNTLIQNNRKVMVDLLERHEFTLQNVDKLIMYNLGKSVMDKIIEVVEIPIENTSYYLSKHVGHIGAADIFYNLKMMLDDGKIVKGDLVAIFSAGAGFSWSSALIQY